MEERKFSEQELVRREKMQELIDKGIDPFGQRFDVTAYSKGIKEQYGDKTHEELEEMAVEVAVAGRILQTGDELLPFSSLFMEKISLPADKNNIAFTFSALNYAVVNTDIYEYFLEGYDKEWLTLMKGN